VVLAWLVQIKRQSSVLVSLHLPLLRQDVHNRPELRLLKSDDSKAWVRGYCTLQRFAGWRSSLVSRLSLFPANRHLAQNVAPTYVHPAFRTDATIETRGLGRSALYRG
jgi:hypothetical protein